MTKNRVSKPQHGQLHLQVQFQSPVHFEALERQVFQRVLEVGVAINAAERIVEICAKGGKKIRDKYASAFSKSFAPNTDPPVEAPRRDVLLNQLRSAPDFEN